MNEKYKKYAVWTVGLIVILVVFYILYPKYYFLDNGLKRCNTITGSCDIRTSKGTWRNLAK